MSSPVSLAVWLSDCLSGRLSASLCVRCTSVTLCLACQDDKCLLCSLLLAVCCLRFAACCLQHAAGAPANVNLTFDCILIKKCSNIQMEAVKIYGGAQKLSVRSPMLTKKFNRLDLPITQNYFTQSYCSQSKGARDRRAGRWALVRI